MLEGYNFTHNYCTRNKIHISSYQRMGLNEMNYIEQNRVAKNFYAYNSTS